MKNIPISAFRSEIQTEVPGCPLLEIDRQVRRAIIQLCEDSYIWKQELFPQAVSSGVREVRLFVPTGSRIAAVIQVFQDDYLVKPATELLLGDILPETRNREYRSDVAEYYYLEDRSTVVLALTPEKRTQLNVLALLKPEQRAASVPSFIFEDYVEAVAMGAKYRLMLMSGKAWSNPNLAEVNRQLFKRESRKIKSERVNDFTKTSSHYVRPVSYW